MLRRILALACAGMLAASACAEAARTFFGMDTAMTLRVWGGDDALLDDCAAEIARLEALFSTTDANSEIARLNAGETVSLSEDTLTLLAFALKMGEDTDGALDVTLYPVVRAWGFTTGEYRMPEEDELRALLEHVDYRSVRLEEGAASLPEGTMVDLGSVAKGYASDKLAAMLRSRGIGTALIDLGGNIYCLGGKEDGSDWRVGVRDPLGDGYCAVLTLRDCAVITSGSYERYFETEDGVRYGHIFDPATGHPVDGGLLSVTVVGESGALCDALSTALFVMGADRAAEFLAGQDAVRAVLIEEDGTFLVSQGLQSQFELAQTFSERKIQWIE